MGVNELRALIFKAVEQLNMYELSPTGQKLVAHYFNSSSAETTYQRALDAIERYIPERLPSPERPASARIEALLAELKREADNIDSEG